MTDHIKLAEYHMPNEDEFEDDTERAHETPTQKLARVVRQRDAMGMKAAEIAIAAKRDAERTTGEGYTYECGREDAAREILAALDAA